MQHKITEHYNKYIDNGHILKKNLPVKLRSRHKCCIMWSIEIFSQTLC